MLPQPTPRQQQGVLGPKVSFWRQATASPCGSAPRKLRSWLDLGGGVSHAKRARAIERALLASVRAGRRRSLNLTAKESGVPATTSQAVATGLTRAAIFLVVTVAEGAEAEATARKLCGDLAGLVRAVGFRSIDSGLSCVMGIGSDAWDRLLGSPKPAELHPFREINGVHHAPSTPGDFLFHIRAERMDLCFELAALIMSRLGDAASVADEVHGFKYFDNRDLLGFVDGTENPVAQAAVDAVLIGDEDAAFAGGSYVIVQKYLHDLVRWNAMPIEQQEKVIGREKLSDVELDDAVKPSFAHNVLTSITDEDGEDLEILRDNMPFGDVGKGEFGTYFIGYARSPSRTERMLNNMFVGDPPSNYDRILDVSRAATGSLYFIPTAPFLEGIGALAGPAPAAPPSGPAVGDQADAPPSRPSADGSLGIGSLKKETGHG
jgi:putative iron-dependent peroxidase